MPASLRCLALCLLVAGTAPRASAGQEERGAWLALGFGGAGLVGSESGVALSALASFSHVSGSRLITVRGSGSVALFDDAVADLGVLVGRWSRDSGTLTFWAVGLGPVVVDDCGGGFLGGTCETTWTVGVPMMAGLGLGGVVGFNLEVFANANFSRPFLGVVLALRMGSAPDGGS